MESLKQALTMGLTGAIAFFTASLFGLPTWVLFMDWINVSINERIESKIQ